MYNSRKPHKKCNTKEGLPFAAKALLTPCERNKQLEEIICITMHQKHGRFWQRKAQNLIYLKR